MARATSDPRVVHLVNFAARDLDVPPSPRVWDRLRDELRQFCSGTGGWEDPSSTLIGIGPPEPPTIEEMRAIHADVRRQLVNVVDDAVDLHVARLEGRHQMVAVSVELAAGLHPVGGGRSFLMVRGQSWRATVLGVAAVLLSRDPVPPVLRCARPRCPNFLARAGKRKFCSRQCEHSREVQAARAAAKVTATGGKKITAKGGKKITASSKTTAGTKKRTPHTRRG